MSQKEKLLKKAKLLWELVTTSQGVADLAEPMSRVERYFERLAKTQRITVATIAAKFEKGCNEINKEEESKETTEILQADEIIPPQEKDEEQKD